MTAFSLSAVGCLKWEGSIAFSANFLVAVEFFSNGSDGRIHDSSSESEDQMKGGLLLDVVIGKGASIYINKALP